MGYAVEMIRSGRADVVVAGGTEAAVHALPIAGFAAMQALSTRNDDPEAASRPYDTGRDGFVLGEGAAVIVLETLEHAQARGAKIYAELAGVGMSSDAHHITAPEPEGAGASRAMLEAVERAGLGLKDIAHINAHATSTPVGDIAEYNAIKRAFGDAIDDIPVTATKSMTGHLLGAAGALEGVLTILSVHHRLVPATINLDDQDPAIPLDVVTGEPRKLPQGDIAALTNSFGFGGHNAALTSRRNAARRGYGAARPRTSACAPGRRAPTVVSGRPARTAVSPPCAASAPARRPPRSGRARARRPSRHPVAGRSRAAARPGPPGSARSRRAGGPR